MATTIGNRIVLDGAFTDWLAAEMVMTSANAVSGYQIYGASLADATLGQTFVIGVDATSASDPVIAAGTVIYLNAHQNGATGYSPSFAAGKIGAEYEIVFAKTAGVLRPTLYSVTSTGALTALNGAQPLAFAVSSDGRSVEVAAPQSLLAPAGGTAPPSINFAALINNATGLPGDFNNNPEYTIPAAATVAPPPPPNLSVKKVGIVYSATTAALYFGGAAAGQTAYADLFMTAQHQAEAAGVSYDLLTEADLTNVAKLSQYGALIFPSFQNVQASQLSAIQSALNQVVGQSHVAIITAGTFMTNDQTGAALAGNPYAAMQTLLNLTPSASGTATYSVIPDAAALAARNPILSGYAAGQRIGGESGLFAGTTQGYYTNSGYTTFSGNTAPATTIADIQISGGAALPGVVQSSTGATVFATTGLFGDSNLLQHVIQNAVFGTTPSLAIDATRFAGLVNSRDDMDQSQFPSDVSPSGKSGIYAQMMPILQSLKSQYDFVGSYYINIGDNTAKGQTTNWSVSLPYYNQLLQMGNEIGDHSYTHLLNPPSGVPSEDTNALGTGAGPFTYSYEFGASKTVEQQNIGITIAGAAVPGANDLLPDSQQILSYFPSGSGLTGYVSGGWTGVGSGSPNAIGYITPANANSVYVAPNITFDFTEIQYGGKTAAAALADWESLFNQLSANSATPIIVWPWHDYGITDWTTSGSDPGYTQGLFSGFVQYAYAAGYEFVTAEQLAQRVAAQQAATLAESTAVNAGGATVVTASVTPSAANPDLGGMALNVVNGAAGQVIANAGSWYAYDANSVFLANDAANKAAAETFVVTLGAAQDDVTHVDVLPMRADLLSATGDGTNLTFVFAGDGLVDIHLKTPAANANVVSVQASIAGTEGAGWAAPVARLAGNDLQLTFNDGLESISSASPQGVPVTHTVTITESGFAVAGAAFVFAAPAVAIAGSGGLTNQKTVTISGTATEPTASQVVGTTVSLYDNGSTTALGTATVKAGVSGGLPTWSATVTLSGDGTHSIVASDTDLSRLTGSSAPVVYTLDTVAPTVAITTAGGATSNATQTIAGTVTATGAAAAGRTVTVYDNGAAVGTATLANGAWSTTVTLKAGANSIVASDTDAAGNTGASGAVAFTLNPATGPTVAIATAGIITNKATQTIAGTVTVSGAAAGSIVTLTDNGALIGTATLSNGSWSTSVTLSEGANFITASDTDAGGLTGTSGVTFTLDTQTPTVAIGSTAGAVSSATQTIAGTVSESVASNVVGSTVSLFDNGSTTAFATAVVQAGVGGAAPTWSTTATLAAGAHSIVAKDVDLAGNVGTSSAVVYSVATRPAPTIASEGYSGTKKKGHWILGGGATAGATVTVNDGATALGTTTATSAGTWSFTTALSKTAAHDFTAVAAGAVSAHVYEGSSGDDTFSLASEAALSSAALIDGGAGTNTLQMTGAAIVTDADFAHVAAVQVLGLAGASGVTLGTNAANAGVATVTTGAGATSVTASGQSLTIDASAMAAGQTLTLAGSSAEQVTAAANVDARGETGALSLTVTGVGSILTGTGAETITASKGGNTIALNGQGDSVAVTGHTAADSFVFSSTGASTNTAAGRDTITGFVASGSIRDLLDVSAINPNLAIQGAVSASGGGRRSGGGTATVAADSVAWLYSGGAAMVYVNTTASALSTGSASLMAINLAGVSSGLSATNFRA